MTAGQTVGLERVFADIVSGSFLCMSIQIKPKTLRGEWTQGFALDVHTTSKNGSSKGSFCACLNAHEEFIVTSVFIGGSRAISKLDDVIREQLENLIAKRCAILIGDANGTDKAVQKYFAQKQYPNVTVFCMQYCRNNIGGWQTRPITAPPKTKGFEYYASKDAAMAQQANCGLMLWDGESRGTLNNVLNLLGHGKKVMVYLEPCKSFYKLANEADLDALLARCDPNTIQDLKRRLEPQLRFHQL